MACAPPDLGQLVGLRHDDDCVVALPEIEC
jgi:hypothetical protein